MLCYNLADKGDGYIMVVPDKELQEVWFGYDQDLLLSKAKNILDKK